MNNISQIEKCTGCGACEYICPVHAIKMERNEIGFLSPHIDNSICVDCGICLKNCHSNSRRIIIEKHHNYYDVFCGWHKNDKIRKASSSGGVFSVISEDTIRDGGVVFAHVFNSDEKCVECVKVSSLDGLQPARTSKYVESDISKNQIFNSISETLENGQRTVFFGTPCQVAGIKSIFGNNKNLVTISFLCHGVAAPRVFAKYLEEIEERFHSKIESINFRNKRLGWHESLIEICFDNRKRVYRHYSVDPYYYCDIVKSLYLRDCCYACDYHSGHVSDITIGDYWGIKTNSTVQDNNTGVSLVIANTENGYKLLEKCKHSMVSFELTPKDIEYAFYNTSNNDPSHFIEQRSSFVKEMDRIGFEKAAKKYMPNLFIPYIKVGVKEVLLCLKKNIKI